MTIAMKGVVDERLGLTIDSAVGRTLSVNNVSTESFEGNGTLFNKVRSLTNHTHGIETHRLRK